MLPLLYHRHLDASVLVGTDLRPFPCGAALCMHRFRSCCGLLFRQSQRFSHTFPSYVEQCAPVLRWCYFYQHQPDMAHLPDLSGSQCLHTARFGRHPTHLCRTSKHLLAASHLFPKQHVELYPHIVGCSHCPFWSRVACSQVLPSVDR